VALEKQDFAFLDWLVKLAIETLIPSAKPACSLAMVHELEGDRTPARKRSRRKAHRDGGLPSQSHNAAA
jgi:hypothetical protein